MANCCGGSGVDKEAQRQNKLISKQLHDEKKGLENEIKLLLLGIKHVQSHIYWFKSHFSPLVFRIERERADACYGDSNQQISPPYLASLFSINL
jgi:hypothetical protein